MDYKLKRFCIVGSLSVMLLVFLLVIYFNQEKGSTPNTQGTSVPVEKEQTPKVTYAEGVTTDKGYQIGYSLTGFWRDEDFFDKEPQETPDEKERVSLMVTSVEKDLRIQVLDQTGELVTGEPFCIILENVGEYEDTDGDGVIYIDSIASGEYKLYLKPVENYQVPMSITRVHVKNKVEYVAIRDISVLIKTEADINALEEDAEKKEALEEESPSDWKDLKIDKENAISGIDLSKWNEVTDWQAVKDAGVEFAIIRAGYRGTVTGALVVDPAFAEHMQGAAEVGIQTGVYFFTQAINEVEAVEEASMVVELLKQYNVQYPVFIDTEGAGGDGRADGLDIATRTAVCEAFCNTIENEGYKAGVYASRNWYNNKLDMSAFGNHYIWLAEYCDEPLYEGDYHMWQYTSKGQIAGIEGNVDRNVSYIVQ